MYTIEYTLPISGDGLQIASYDTGIAANVQEFARPIKMTVTTCVSKLGEISFLEAVHLNNGNSEYFDQHYREILAGLHETWRLTSVGVDVDSVNFCYRNSETRKTGCISLCIDGTKIDNLDLLLEVPHDDHRAPTKYTIRMSRMPTQGSTIYTFVDVYLPNQRKMFTFASDEPNVITVTEYCDL